MSEPVNIADLVLASRQRVMSAARAACQRFGCDFSWAEDIAQEIAVQQLAGGMVRLDRRGLDWQMNAILNAWLSSRVKPETIQTYVRQTTAPASDPVVFADLQQIYERATDAQRRAIQSLMLHGQFTCGDLSRQEQQQRGQALYALRKKIAPDVQQKVIA